MLLGKVNLEKPLVFTNAAAPNEFAGWPYRAEGVIGNAPFWNGIVVLDLTVRARLGFAR